MKKNKEKEVTFGKAIAVGANTVAEKVKKWIANAPNRAEAAHETKLKLLERQRKELEVENKVMKLEKDREQLRPKDSGNDFFGKTHGSSKVDNWFDSMI